MRPPHKRSRVFESQQSFQESQYRKRSFVWGGVVAGVVIIAAMVSFVIVVGLPAFKRLPIFRFNAVQVLATEHITEQELKDLIGKPTHENIFDLSLEKIQESVKKNPWVLTISVRRLYPDRLRVEVAEKNPVALLVENGKLYFLDDAGLRIAPVRPSEKVDFPILSGTPSPDVVLGAYRLMALYKENPFLSQWTLSEVRYHLKTGFLFVTKSPAFEIRLGQDGFIKKMTRLEKVLKDLYQKDAVPSLIDLNFSKKVVVKLAK